jgi:hypothetical protein
MWSMGRDVLPVLRMRSFLKVGGNTECRGFGVG